MTIDLTLAAVVSKLHNLSLYEPTDPVVLNKLLQSTLLKETFNNRKVGEIYKNEEQQLTEYKKLVKVTKKLATVAYARVKYSRPKGMKFGRCNPERGLGLYNIRREIRHTLALPFLEDIDIKNCHPVILHQVLKSNHLESIAGKLKAYIDDRDTYLNEVSTHYNVPKDAAKKLFIKLLYGGGIASWRVDNSVDGNIVDMPFLDDFKTEFAHIASIITNHNPILKKEVIKRKAEQEKTNYNLNGCVISYFLQEYECRILEQCYLYCVDNGYIVNNITVLAADGFMIPKDKYTPSLLCELEHHIMEKTGFELTFVNKAMDMGFLDILDSHLIVTNNAAVATDDDEFSFKRVVEEFEKTHCKIINKSCFIKQLDDSVVIMNDKQLKVAYSHVFFNKKQLEGIRGVWVNSKTSFITEWISHNHPIRMYDDIGIFPVPTDCPTNIYNIWVPFAAEKFVGNCDKEGVGFILNHILLMCNNDNDVFNYILKWCGHLFQYPQFKSTSPTFVGKEGDGKSTIIRILNRLIGGTKRVLETTNPSRDVWGSFNSLMASAFLVNLNELSKKDTIDAEGYIKGLITEPTITINGKGQAPYNISSYHRFIVTTNKEDTIKTELGDRRKIVIRTNSEKKGNTEYFNKLYSFIDDDTVIRNLYDYFMSVEVLPNFLNLPIPETEFQQNLKDKNRPIPEQWLEDFVRENHKKKTIEMLGRDIYGEFTDWSRENGVKYETSAISLCLYLKNAKIEGIEKGKVTNKGNNTLFDIMKLKKHFNIGCLVDLV